jgi:hypothetical protein
MEFIAVMSLTNTLGIGIIDIDYSDDTINSAFTDGSCISRCKVRYTTSDKPYFIKKGIRYYLNEFCRV